MDLCGSYFYSIPVGFCSGVGDRMVFILTMNSDDWSLRKSARGGVEGQWDALMTNMHNFQLTVVVDFFTVSLASLGGSLSLLRDLFWIVSC